jgi:hypothetical protein
MQDFTSPYAHTAWWQWPTVLSLDAPLVCLAWQAAVAASAGVVLAWPQAAVLGASVWLAYVADRWFEGWRLDSPAVRTARHRFHQRQRWPVFACWVAVFALDIALAVDGLDARLLLRGLVLLAPVLAYLLSHQIIHRHRSWRAPKELLVAALLTAGIAVFVPRPWPAGVLWSLAAFAMVSFVNCALISAWERDVDLAHGQTSLALQSHHSPALIRALPWIAAVAGAMAAPVVPAGARLPMACAAASALLLGVVDRIEPWLGWAAARVLAEAALLTPIVPLAWPGAW